jgi:hypothetical protein
MPPESTASTEARNIYRGFIQFEERSAALYLEPACFSTAAKRGSSRVNFQTKIRSRGLMPYSGSWKHASRTPR